MPIAHFDWQVLRSVLRSGKTPPTGRQLRLLPTRRTKDGSFLTDLVNRGLLKVVKVAPDPFSATYALTPLGEHAAEYGEYEWEPSRKVIPASTAMERKSKLS